MEFAASAPRDLRDRPERREDVAAEPVAACLRSPRLPVEASGRRREEQLRQTEKMEAIARLAGEVAHDLNNLLLAIRGYAWLLLERLAEDDPARRDAEEIDRAVEASAVLARQLLVLSGRVTLCPAVIDLNAVVGGMCQTLAGLIGEDVTLDLLLEPGPANVRADGAGIEQALVNLAVNAREAMPEGGRLVIETAGAAVDATAGEHAAVPSGGYVRLSVRDTGRGMDAETRSRIFEPFFTTKEGGKRRGFGLAAVYAIVRQCGGFIWVESEPDRGAVFDLYLPCADEAEVDGR